MALSISPLFSTSGEGKCVTFDRQVGKSGLVLTIISSRSFIGGNYWTTPSRSRLGRLCEQTTSGLDREPVVGRERPF